MIPIIFSLQNKLNQVNNKVLAEIHKLSDNFSKLESKLSVSKQVNSLLPHRLGNMEHPCQANVQYWRRECLDIIDIQVVNIFKKLDCKVSKNSATVIIKFPRRKNYQHVLTVKKDLHKTKMEDVDLSGQNKLFIRTCVHIIKYQGLKVKICMVQARSIVPLFWRPQSRLKSVKIVCLCP